MIIWRGIQHSVNYVSPVSPQNQPKMCDNEEQQPIEEIQSEKEVENTTEDEIQQVEVPITEVLESIEANPLEEMPEKQVHEEDEPETGVVTMLDVLEEEQQLEDDANAVLGGSDPQYCTYEQGYVPRQALYACMTCSKDQNAGVCLACSYHCHEGHELVELYTKRNFRCDCGNSLFTRPCNLQSEKDPINNLNAYNHNFTGVYCVCRRPYPDPEDPVSDEMIQCVICEDWLHGRHLDGPLPVSTPFAEMICASCVKEHSFLLDYVGEINVDVLGDSCTRPKPSSDIDNMLSSSLFWPENWRMKLCKCKDCIEMYEKENVSFLLDVNDTVHAYELRGKNRVGENSASSYEAGMKALSSMERTAQVEAISHYNHMKDELKDYLQGFAEAGRIVREEDIRDFFSRMNAKRPRLDLPYSCR